MHADFKENAGSSCRFDSLELLSVVAAAVFAYRKNDLLEATTRKQAEHILSDLVVLNVTTLLQFSLFGHPV